MKGIVGVVAVAVLAVFPVVQAAERHSPETCNAAMAELKSKFPESDLASLMPTITSLSTSSLLRYMAGSDSIFGDMKKEFGPSPLINELDMVKSKLDDTQKRYWLEKSRYEAFLVESGTKKYFSKDSPYRPQSSRLVNCATQTVYFGAVKPGQYDGFSESSFRKGRFGHFTVGMNSCEIKKSVGTASRFSEPDEWAGSKFVVIDATFKNEDSEGRLPSEGSLVIVTPDKKELRYDTTESVMQKGYGIYFKSVNPLVTMPTKIVYRIPEDITGEILWEPGRNPEGKRLWCVFSKSNK